MITKLIEDGKRKAHQYWPDDTDGEESLGHVYELGGGIRVEHLSSSFQVVVAAVIIVAVIFVVADYRPVCFTFSPLSRGRTSSGGSASSWRTGLNVRSFSSTQRSGRILQLLMSPGLTNDSFQSSSGDFRILLDLVFKASDLQKANEIDQGTT